MKKFYSIILCALVANFAVPAFAGSFIFWVDDRSVATNVFSVDEGDTYPAANKFGDGIVNGYNVLEPKDFSNLLVLTFYGPTGPFTTWAYINGVKQASETGQPSYYKLTVAENDVVKVFLTGEPTECAVNFSGSGLESVGIIADKVVSVETSAAFACFNGTEMIITPNGDATIEVGVNGAAVDADAEGKFVFVVNDATTNVVVNLKGSGIFSAINDTADNAEVYNLQGIRVSNDVNTLPAGVYIRGGKKILVR
ncbi:MAG: hypothetical protein ACI31C_08110 [Muribaculaceae bacterium]